MLALMTSGCFFEQGEFVEPDMIAVPAGCFDMGSPVTEAWRRDDERQHQVCVEAFSLGRYEVTQAEWRSLIPLNPSLQDDCPDCPVENVSWNDALNYIALLNAKTGQHYRLPTEAEWEYACRNAGQSTSLYCGEESDPGVIAWFTDNSEGHPHPVGQKTANGLGFHDMSGNVWEWTCSRYDENYQQDEEKQCVDRIRIGGRVFRGGSWENAAHRLRAAVRYRISQTHTSKTIGFRLALDPQEPEPEESEEAKSAKDEKK
jgi:formylglycine-generating enzyme required for sulfatase activity